MDFLRIILWVVFFAAALLLAAVVLLQEGKGGGLADAFGGVGAETFGVKTTGISRFTYALAGAYMVAAILLHATWNL